MENSDLGSMLGSILSDPKAMESIQQVAKSLNLNGLQADGKDEALPVALPKAGGKTGELNALLLATKPFLGQEKRKTVDDAIGILRLISLGGQTDLLKNLTGLLP